MSKVIDDSNVGRLVSDIKAKADASYWPKDQTQEVNLATVATTGDYADLLNRPSGGVGSFIYVGTCPTEAATATKVVTVETFPTSNGAPLVGTVIAVKFAITNTAATPKLNVNSLGAQSIYYNTAVATSTSGIYGGTKDRYCYYFWDGTNWVWLTQGTEANDNTLAYQVRTSGQRLTVSSACYRYRLLFRSADGTKLVPANASSSTNATATRTTTQTPIDPFGQILYYSYTTALSSGGQPSASYQYQQYNGITLGYSFNRTGEALELTTMAPLYIKAAPQADGSAIIDADTPYVQALPSTNDGKIYIFLGIAISATTFELMLTHPVYYYDGTGIRHWTGVRPYTKPSGGIPASDLASGVIPTVPTISTDIAADKASTTKTAAPSAVYNEVHPAIATTQPSGGFLPNVVYDLGTVTGTVTFSLAAASDATIPNAYFWTFETGSTAPTITWPSNITWAGGSAPTISASKHYEIMIRNGYGTFIEI